MLIFSTGDVKSVLIMLRWLKTFSMASGLTTNASKSSIFSAKKDIQELEDICELTGYEKGKLPFKYLGFPILAKRLSAIDCEALISKWSSRVNTWVSDNISYAGRVQLVNSVLIQVLLLVCYTNIA